MFGWPWICLCIFFSTKIVHEVTEIQLSYEVLCIILIMFLLTFLVLNKCNVNREASLDFKLTHFILLLFSLCWDTSSELWAREKSFAVPVHPFFCWSQCSRAETLQICECWGTHCGWQVDSAVSQALANASFRHQSGVRDCYASFFLWMENWMRAHTHKHKLSVLLLTQLGHNLLRRDTQC